VDGSAEALREQFTHIDGDALRHCTEEILTHLGLPARSPPRAPARRLALFLAACFLKARTALQRR
jgi:hypothetical protein